MERLDLAIVIPAFNEERTIGKMVADCRSFGRVIVANDASSDKTAEIAEKNGATVVSLSNNGGYDAALNIGFKKAAELQSQFVITVDADGQHDVSVIPMFLNLLRNGADLVVGKRDRKARVAEKVFGSFTSLLYGIHDPLCGMKGYRMRVFSELGHFDSKRSIGTELALFAARKKYLVKEIDLKVRERSDAPRFGSALKANVRIFRALALSLFS